MVETEGTDRAGGMKNPIILEFGSFDSEDISDLRDGEGKIYKQITKAIARLQNEEVIDKEVQPVIAVIKKKAKKLFD